MYSFLLHLHSGMRHIALLLLFIAIVVAFVGIFGKKNYTGANRKLNLFTLIAIHLQLVIGLVLYFVSPNVNFSQMGNDVFRYWNVEHITGMLIAIILVTVGHSKAKKANTDLGKFRSIATFYTLAFVIILAVIAIMPIANKWGF